MTMNEKEALFKMLFEATGMVHDLDRKLLELAKCIDEIQEQQSIRITIEPEDECEEYIEPDEVNIINDLSKQVLTNVLQQFNGDRKKAARYLGISERTLYRRLKQNGIIKNN